MASSPLIDDFLQLLAQRDTSQADLEQWQRRFQTHLGQLSRTDAERELREMQAIVQENKALFEAEAADILKALVPENKDRQQQARARHYRDIGKL